MILLESNFWSFVFDTHHIIKYGGLILILVIVYMETGFTWVCTLVPLGYYIGEAYPDVMKYSIYIIFIFIVIASLPMLKIMFSKIKKS